MIGTILLYVNLLASVIALCLFVSSAKKSKEMRPVLVMFSVNLSIMIVLYVLLLFGVELPDITGRINLTLILATLIASAAIIRDRYAP